MGGGRSRNVSWRVLFLVAVVTSSCARLDPRLPHSWDLPEARISTGRADAPQKVRFPPYLRYQPTHGSTHEPYLVLPAGWNVYAGGCDHDWCWGTVETTRGRVIRWASGVVGSGLDGGDSVIWQRSEPGLSYGVVREFGKVELRVNAAGMVLFAAADTRDEIDEVLSFARSEATTVAPCRDCVKPAFRKSAWRPCCGE